MSNLKDFVELGEKFGLKGDELRKYAEDKDRERRAEERDLKKIELEIVEKQQAISVKSETEHANANYRAPKLPSFDESMDSLDVYIQRFERFALVQKWEENLKAMYLGTLLRGKALEVYTRLTADEANDYNKLKSALLRAYQLTEDGFKTKFYTAKPEVNETPAQFAYRLESYFDKWVEMSGVTNDYNSLRLLILKEQFMINLPRDMHIFLKERSPKDLSNSIKLAETFMEARGWYRLGASEKRTGGSPSKKPVSNSNVEHKCPKSNDKQTDRRPICYNCNKPGHLARDCFSKSFNNKRHIASAVCEDEYNLDSINSRSAGTTDQTVHQCSIDNGNAYLKCGCSMVVLGSLLQNQNISLSSLPINDGLIGDIKVRVMRDTGCNGVVVRRSLITNDSLTGSIQKFVMIDHTVRTAPIAKISVNTPFYKGEVEALCLENPICDLVIGNIPGAIIAPEIPKQIMESKAIEQKLIQDNKSVNDNEVVVSVQTRSQTKSREVPFKPLIVPDIIKTTTSSDDLRDKQRSDNSLRRLCILGERKISKATPNGVEKYTIQKGILYRHFRKNDSYHEIKQLVVPTDMRLAVLKHGHESLMSGHLGITKTADRILANFYWPGIRGDITRFCQSCDLCQKTVPKGRVTKVPVEKMPIIDTPFHRVAIDIVGPIEPRSKSGNRYILTMVDYATRYPEAVALPSIETERVAEALVNIFSRTGVPKEVLSDNASNFTSQMMVEICRLLSIDQLHSTPYHAMCNGLVEKFNGTLKRMLRKMCSECPAEWDRYIQPLLFAYREVPQESMRFSPFELVYGRTIRGPMTVLRELWTKDDLEVNVKTTYEYVLDLRNRLEHTCKLAHENLINAQDRYKRYYDKNAKARTLTPGSKVIILLPTKQNKLLMQWKGPYTVVEKIGVNDYRIQMGSKVKLFHINMLKEYKERSNPTIVNVIKVIKGKDNVGPIL